LGIAVEDQQGMIHMLAVVAVVGGAFLVAVGRIVGAIAVQENAPRRARSPALAPIQGS
jgi:hypothetical protein